MFMEIGQFLNLRLKQMGIQHLFGVPGDFNLSYLEQVEADQELKFIGNCNELNAAYAADGYARINGFSALVTTYGVGDLSAINGIAGAYAENVALVHISGIPPLAAVQQGQLIHHTLVDGNYENIMNCMKEFSVAQTRLTPENAVDEIDRVLRQCIIKRRPVHIQLASDITHIKINCPYRLLDLSDPQIETDVLQTIVTQLCDVIHRADRPALLIDQEASVFEVTKIVADIAQKCSIPFAVMPTAKNIMDEGAQDFVGCYMGGASQSHVRHVIEQSDCLIGVGVRFSDIGTAVFSHQISTQQYIEIRPHTLNIFGQSFLKIEIKQLLQELYINLLPRQLITPPREKQQYKYINDYGNQKLNQEVLWQNIEAFLKEDDIIIAEAGTAHASLVGLTLPTTAHYIAQPLWASIGYTLPALLGSSLAAKDRRQILFIGDGAFQMTAQELSTIIRYQLKPIIFLINNGGYTIERLIMGENASYNDIQNWQYTALVDVFSEQKNYFSKVIENTEQLREVLSDLKQENRLCFIELKLSALDAPLSLKKFAATIAHFDYGQHCITESKKISSKVDCEQALNI
ncbi:thiamine pyrophosphate-binding protein [Acinetobacter rudis]|uniref:alpha-keto acid decarboxylase family protein n=1 Tax=Acinetobacter rudis TaxID=632955 RepID=UPI00280FBBB3|nr:thiamine pyrophosphate-binding protein [Acinetobacter rudis]MDQ8951862.1 thiamine pyrophosphate-binding protein [Acinetobacter rudis]